MRSAITKEAISYAVKSTIDATVKHVVMPAAGAVYNVATRLPQVVEIHNKSRYPARVWCASADDKIGGKEGIVIQPGEKISWSFYVGFTTQFWCTMDWNGQRVGWDVYVANWRDAPNPTKWSIKNNGVYDQWKHRKWCDLEC